MTDPLPLGQKKDLHLEVEGRGALEKPEIIGRDVVAMLNAEGGTVWIGLRDENGRAVAVEPIPDAGRERRRLREYLTDTIEPSPLGDEVEVEVEQVEEEGEVLRVRANPRRERRPYAHLKGGGRFFFVRLGNRIHPMAREEILAALDRSGGEAVSEDGAAERLLDERRALQQSRKGALWLAIEPLGEVEIDLCNPEYLEYLQDPRRTGNRRIGWNFASSRYPVRIGEGKLVTHPEEIRHVEIFRNGSLRFQTPLEALYLRKEREIWPYSLLEFPVSAFRIAREVYRGKLEPEERLLADMALIGIRGWILRGGSPARVPSLNLPSGPFPEADLVRENPLSFTAEELEAEPDRCAFRLIERVYEAFGLSREAIPKEFDQKAGRLVLPE